MEFTDISRWLLSLLFTIGIELQITSTVTLHSDCGIEVQKSTNLNFGYIDWDGAHYNGSINCSYVIKLAPWETVTLTFLKFRLPSTTRNCASGYLTVGTLGHVGTRLCSERDVPLPRKRILRGDSAVITYFSKAAEHDAFMIKYVVVNESLCDRTLNLHAGSNANVSFPSPSDNPQNKTCITRLVAPIGQLIRLTFHYLGSSGDTSNASGWDPVSKGDSEKCKGIKGIITVGNHLERISDSFSSFRICQHFVPPEYVSRGHTLWMDLADLSVFNERNFKIEYHVLPKAECTEDQFRCSAVQCISRKKLCDGRRDCVNGLDEYCDLDHKKPDCFLCEDGSCIAPKKTFYAFDANKPLWWLCDGYQHCQDGTDERADVCLKLRGRHDSLFYCKPNLPRSRRRNHTVAILKRFLCDGIEHCYHGEDERHPSCQKKKGKSHFRPEWVYVPLTACGVLALGITIIYLSGKTAKKRRSENGEYLVPSVVVNGADDDDSDCEHRDDDVEPSRLIGGTNDRKKQKKTWLSRFMSRSRTAEQIETVT